MFWCLVLMLIQPQKYWGDMSANTSCTLVTRKIPQYPGGLPHHISHSPWHLVRETAAARLLGTAYRCSSAQPILTQLPLVSTWVQPISRDHEGLTGSCAHENEWWHETMDNLRAGPELLFLLFHHMKVLTLARCCIWQANTTKRYKIFCKSEFRIQTCILLIKSNESTSTQPWTTSTFMSRRQVAHLVQLLLLLLLLPTCLQLLLLGHGKHWNALKGKSWCQTVKKNRVKPMFNDDTRYLSIWGSIGGWNQRIRLLLPQLHLLQLELLLL